MDERCESIRHRFVEFSPLPNPTGESEDPDMRRPALLVAGVTSALLWLTGCAGADSTGPAYSSSASSSAASSSALGASRSVTTTTVEVPLTTPDAPQQAAGPAIGDACIGADIGRRAVDANGTAIVCDNYEWTVDNGQTPRHPWADDQTQSPTPTAQCTDGAAINNGGGNYTTCENGQWRSVRPTYDPNSADGYGPNQPLPPLCVRFPDKYTC